MLCSAWLSDDASAWQRYTNLGLRCGSRFRSHHARGGRSLYADQANGQAYFTYLMEELPFYLQAIFKLNMSRENSCIAGNSMGGYGAFKAALNYPDRFRAAFSLSGALALGPAIDKSKAASNAQLMHEMGMVSAVGKITGSINDPHWLEMAKQTRGAADLYAVCGDQDDSCRPIAFIAAAQRAGIPVNYREEPGRHDWYFWQAQLKALSARCSWRVLMIENAPTELTLQRFVSPRRKANTSCCP